MKCNYNPASFRDPAAFVFSREGSVYRQINNIYKEDYNHLLNSGLYRTLVEQGLLISHRETESSNANSDGVYKIIKPEPIPFISYPYEWCFSQLQDAAMAILSIQMTALAFGMSLKDSSAYNIQFRDGKPIFIDTSSFESYREGEGWIPYRQFCQHFLAPLALMSYKDACLGQLWRVYIDGIPLDLASSLLPLKTYLRPSIFIHIHLHAKFQKLFSKTSCQYSKIGQHKMSRSNLMALIGSLERAVKNLRWKAWSSEWSSYCEKTLYSADALTHKKELVDKFLDKANPRIVWDVGANTGVFSRIASSKGASTISFDSDAACVESNYLECKRKDEKNILPLLVDLNNPSPGLGWENLERPPVFERGHADVILALALIHHLAIANNLPFNKIAGFFNKLGNYLIIEFVPKDDPQLERMLSRREDIFSHYTQEAFESEFGKYFQIIERLKLKDSKRILYLMRSE